ncbi:MAG: SIMPL domain-containing protein, partial [Candidatus Micrarchaeota archaeon]|nr:SIMPL domain-containing protein [Candidatus Micrarchaeota archaeon]
PYSAEEAKNLNAQLYDAILTALIKSGVDRSNIETRGFSIYPEYNWIENQGLILKGYVVTNSFKVSISNINEAGKIVDAIVDNGGLIDSIIYELSDEKLNKYKSEVLSAASKDARIKAEATLKGLGKELGDIISVSTLEYNFIPYPIFRGSDGVPAKESITNLPPANLEVSASVSVTYKIK